MGKQTESLTTTCKTLIRPIMEHANTIWAPIVSDSNLNKLQKIQNTSLRIASGCTKDTNINQTTILLVKEYLKLHGSISRQNAQYRHILCIVSQLKP